ncbi:MAG: hypothetical protein H0W48_03525 [Methylibium sp.]|nr:hypothetical protein [Methylibium sp.]MBA3623525.1 hypothetical protein [Methylibium sp.]
MKTLWIATLTLTLAAGGAIAADSKPAAPAAAKAVTTTAAVATATAATAKPGAVRDWAEIDKNRDNAVTPEEMEAYLKANPGPQRPKN